MDDAKASSPLRRVGLSIVPEVSTWKQRKNESIDIASKLMKLNQSVIDLVFVTYRRLSAIK